ncbi:MAG: Panacea domain-containing protein, partial [Deltaproteobacteria bacterium]|nr:Panacea domain-containing protein [Deltaproteobacteria bacterium]
EYIAKYKADLNSGFQKLNINKLYQAILFFCENGMLKTKLNKLLFYADFTNFNYYTVSITGARYLHYQHGPVPEKYQSHLAILQEEEFITIEETPIIDYIGEMIISLRKPDLTIFSELEKNTLMEVMRYFKDFNATDIRKFSHDEKGYLETQDREFISYAYADNLQNIRKGS